MKPDPTPTRRLLRPAQAAAKLGISLPTLWRYVREEPTFPRTIKLSGRVTTLDERELDAFIESRRACK